MAEASNTSEDIAAQARAAQLKDEIVRADPVTLRLLLSEARSHHGWIDKPAGEAGVEGPYIERLKVLSEAVDEAVGRHITLNVTGVIGALLGEIGFPAEVMRSVAVVSRAAGLVAHILEEKQDPVTPAIVDKLNEVPYEDPE